MLIARLVLVLLVLRLGTAHLSQHYYDSTCPKFVSLVRDVVKEAISKEARIGASILRLHFHDCFVQGCDASVLLDDTPSFKGEKNAIHNKNSLRGFDVIDKIKAQVERVCPGVVSCADILAVAAREGVVALDGPSWCVPLGRLDSTTANFTAANFELPSASMDLKDLISIFHNKGFTASEMVTLSGAHTIGQASCSNFRERIYNETNLNPLFKMSLLANCSRNEGIGDENLWQIDEVTPTVFDVNYYRNLLVHMGLLHSDQELANSVSTRAQVVTYSLNPIAFFNGFAEAMIKMSKLKPPVGTKGQIRRNCRRVN